MLNHASSTTCSHSSKDYVAGRAVYIYPSLGEPAHPGCAKVQILTEGRICVSGDWSSSAGHLAWSPLPSEADYIHPSAVNRVES